MTPARSFMNSRAHEKRWPDRGHGHTGDNNARQTEEGPALPDCEKRTEE